MTAATGSDRNSQQHPSVAFGIVGERHVPDNDLCSSRVELGLSVHGANTVCLTKSDEHVVDVIAKIFVAPPDPAGYVELEADLVRRHGEPG